VGFLSAFFCFQNNFPEVCNGAVLFLHMHDCANTLWQLERPSPRRGINDTGLTESGDVDSPIYLSLTGPFEFFFPGTGV
jgi:hypothetical protein